MRQTARTALAWRRFKDGAPLVALLLGLAAAAAAEGVPLPAVPKAQAAGCVADSGLMRRNHMAMLEHQRDDTVRRGIRSNRVALTQCVTCHAVAGPDGRPVSFASDKHFCNSCHSYAAVTIDCFDCHASTPAAADGQALEGARPAHQGGETPPLRR